MTPFHAFKWSFLSELASRLIQPIVFIVLARILTPTDFGVMTAAMMVVALSQVLLDAGLGKAVVRQQQNINEAANAAFWINVLLGFLIAAVIYFLADDIAVDIFKDSRVSSVLIAMDLQIIIAALSSVQVAIIQKDFGFKQLFIARTVSGIISGSLSIILAWFGMGYWALVVGAIAGQLLMTISVWIACCWKPSFKIEPAIAIEILKFGFWVCLTGVSTWVFHWIDSLLLAKYLGITDVGLFRVGNQLSTTIFNLAFGFLLPTMYVSFSNTIGVGDPQDVFKKLNRGLLIISTVSLPLGLAVMLVSKEIESAVLGNKWDGVGFVIGMIAIKEAVLWVFALNTEAIRAIGKAKIETTVAIASGISNVVVLYIAVHYGFEVFVLSRSLVLMLIGLMIHLSAYFIVFGFESITCKKLSISIVSFFILSGALVMAERAGVNFILLLPIPLILLFGLLYMNYSIIKDTWNFARG